jgi:proteasome lid subunit RPN8/RPN11
MRLWASLGAARRHGQEARSVEQAALGGRLRLGKRWRQEMLAHLRAVYPDEGCGLLAVGPDGETVAAHYPVRNVAAQPRVAYEGEPEAVLEGLLAMERAGQRLGAIYHSHPGGPAYPSATDVRLHFYPSALTLIVSLVQPAPRLGLFAIHDGRIEPRDLLLDGDREAR